MMLVIELPNGATVEVTVVTQIKWHSDPFLPDIQRALRIKGPLVNEVVILRDYGKHTVGYFTDHLMKIAGASYYTR